MTPEQEKAEREHCEDRAELHLQNHPLVAPRSSLANLLLREPLERRIQELEAEVKLRIKAEHDATEAHRATKYYYEADVATKDARIQELEAENKDLRIGWNEMQQQRTDAQEKLEAAELQDPFISTIKQWAERLRTKEHAADVAAAREQGRAEGYAQGHEEARQLIREEMKNRFGLVL